MALSLVAGTAARSECFSASDPNIQAMKARYQHSAVLIDVVGPEPDKCRDVGTGVLISSAGDILTARHVVDKPGCSNTGLFAIFGWDPPVRVELEPTGHNPNDAAFLRPKDASKWDLVKSKYCTAPVATDEGAADENFLRFGRIDLRATAYGYGGNVILNSTETGQPPLQLVCTIMRPGDSGGPLFSGTTGKLIGIAVRERVRDTYGNPVVNQGYIFPAKYLLAAHRQKFDTRSQCELSLIQKASETNLELEIPYEFTLVAPAPQTPGIPSNPTERSALTTQIFAPTFGYSFNEVEAVVASDANGRHVPFKPCATADAANCVTTLINNNLLTVIARSAPADTGAPPIRAVTVYTKQTLGRSGLEFLFASNPKLHGELMTAIAGQKVSQDQAASVLAELTKAPLDVRRSLSARIETPPLATLDGISKNKEPKIELYGKNQDWFASTNYDALRSAVESTARFQ